MIKACSCSLEQRLYFFWGRCWKLRSSFTSSYVKKRAESFLTEKQRDMFFVLGTGRSGTQLLTELFDRGDGVRTFHEPNFAEDVSTMALFREHQELVRDFWLDFRVVEVFKRWNSFPGTRKYGEVNGTIRYHAPTIRKLFPKAKIFLVTRDGRGVVRSVMGWPQFYGPSSSGAYALQPMPGDPYLDKWHSMSRFEKICWSWQEANEFLMKTIVEDNWLQLEKMASDYEYFKEKISDPLEISIPYKDWLNSVSKKSRNASKQYAFPAWKDWGVEDKGSFERICGETMTRLGYEL